MKKILLTFFISLVSIFSASFAFAQTSEPSAPNAASSEQSIQVSTTTDFNATPDISIKNIRIVSQRGRDFVFSFDISNNSSHIQPGVRYVLQLKKLSLSSAPLLDEFAYNETLSLDAHQSVSKTIGYSIPQTLPSGLYAFFLNVGNSGGFTLAFTQIGEGKIQASAIDVAEIIPNSCHFYLQDEVGSHPGLFFISNTDTLFETCQVQSSFPANIILSPKFETRYHNIFGDVVSTASSSEKLITIANGINTISFPVPKALIPHDYYVSLHLESPDGQIISNTLSLTYFLKGLAGTIENAVFDKLFYKSGDTADLKIFSSIYDIGNASSTHTGTLSVSLSSSGDSACSATETVQVSEANPNMDVPIKISKDCINPSAHIVLSTKDKNGNILTLDTRDFTVITPANYLPKGNQFSYVAILIIFALLAALTVFIRFIFRKKNPSVPMTLLSILIALSIFGFAKSASAIQCFPNPVNATAGYNNWGNNPMNSGYLFCESRNNNPIHVYDMSGVDVAAANFYAARGISYYPYSTGGFLLWPKFNANGLNFNVCDVDGGTQYCQQVFYLAGYQAFQILPHITASPNVVNYGKSSTISYNSTGASYCSVWANSVQVSDPANATWGSFSTGALTKDTTYTESCSGWPQFNSAGGDTGNTVTVYVRPSISITASSTIVPYGSSTAISWSSTGASSCTVTENGSSWQTGNSGTNVNSGNLNSITTFMLSCLGTSGNPNSVATTSVVVVPFSISASPASVLKNSASTISWYAPNIGSCSITKNGSPWKSFAASSTTQKVQIFPPVYDLTFSPERSSFYGMAVDNNSGYVYSTIPGCAIAYVPASSSGCVAKFDSNGNFISGFGSVGSGNGQFGVNVSPGPYYPAGPAGAAVDASGNVYVTDTVNDRVEKFNSSGKYLAQFGSSGAANGQFKGPNGIAIDSAGYIYVVNTGNDRIDKFSPTIVSTGFNFINDFGSYANYTKNPGTFQSIGDMAVDAAGNIYVEDPQNYRVEKFDSSGNYLLKFGSYANYTKNPGTFQSVGPLAIDSLHNVVYVEDPQNYRIQKFDALGNYLLSFGSKDARYTGAPGTFLSIGPLAVDSLHNVVYVEDPQNYRIEKFDALGNYLLSFGSKDTRYTGAPGTFQSIGDMAVDAAGNIYVEDPPNYRIQKFNSSGVYQLSFGSRDSKYNAAPGTFQSLGAMTIDSSGNIYVEDPQNYRVEKFNSSGVYQLSFGSRDSKYNAAPGTFQSLGDIGIDSYGFVYVEDLQNYRVEIFNSTSGAYVSSFGSYANYTKDPGKFQSIGSMVIDPEFKGSGFTNAGAYVADPSNYRIEKFGPNIGYNYISSIGVGKLNNPRDLALDQSGNIYVSEGSLTLNVTGDVLKFDSSGKYVSALIPAANYPYGIGVDSFGNVYVDENRGFNIGIYSPSGSKISSFGSQGIGPGQFRSSYGLAVDKNDNIYVSDTYYNKNIQKFTTLSTTSTTTYYSDFTGSDTSGNLTFDTPFVLSCIAPWGNATSSVTVTINTNLSPGPPGNLTWGSSPSPSGSATCSSITITWTESDPSAVDFNVYRDTTTIPIANVNTTSYIDNTLNATSPPHTYYVSACNASGICSSPVQAQISSVSPTSCQATPPGGGGTSQTVSCTPSQLDSLGNPSSTIYINKQMTWTINVNPSATITSTTWSGDDVSSTITSGISFPKIYTTIGNKTINATANGTLSGKTYTAICSTTTTVKSSGGGGGEI